MEWGREAIKIFFTMLTNQNQKCLCSSVNYFFSFSFIQYQDILIHIPFIHSFIHLFNLSLLALHDKTNCVCCVRLNLNTPIQNNWQFIKFTINVKIAVCGVMIISRHRQLDISEIFLLEYNDPHYIRHSMMHACAGFNQVSKTSV